MTDTVIVRKPSLAVTLNGTPLTGVLSARTAHGYDQRMAEATVVLQALPAGIMPWDIIEITMGGTVASAALRFSGFFVSHENQLYPKQTTLNCKGMLAMADVEWKDVNEDMSSAGAGHTDEMMVSTVLWICGLTSPGYTLIGEIADTGIGGTGRLLGKYSFGRGFDWKQGVSALSFIEQLEEVGLGWRTFDTFGGSIVRQLISSAPAVTADWTFTEGVDIYRATESATVLEAKNRIIATGFPGFDSKSLITYTADGANTFLWNNTYNVQWYATENVSSPMIEKQNTADAVNGMGAGDGLSCEAVATWRLGELNRYVERVNLTTPRDDLVAPGDTIAVVSPDRLGVNRNFWVQSVDAAVSQANQFSQVLTCLTGWPAPVS
jgi:hypothetical protein